MRGIRMEKDIILYYGNAAGYDDKLQYRLGQMLYSGTGTEQDIPAAMVYFEKAAKV